MLRAKHEPIVNTRQPGGNVNRGLISGNRTPPRVRESARSGYRARCPPACQLATAARDPISTREVYPRAGLFGPCGRIIVAIGARLGHSAAALDHHSARRRLGAMVGYVGPPGLSGGNSRIDVGCPRSGQWPAMHPARTQCAVRRR